MTIFNTAARAQLQAQLTQNLKQQRDYVREGKSPRQVYEDLLALKEMGETLWTIADVQDELMVACLEH